MRAAIAAPLLHGGSLLGSLSVNSYNPSKKFTSGDAETLELLAGIAAAQLVGLERANLLASTLAAREVAHRLNNNLAIVAGAVELVRSQAHLPPGLDDLLGEALAELEKSAGWVARLQQLTRFRTKETPICLALDLDLSTAPR